VSVMQALRRLVMSKRRRPEKVRVSWTMSCNLSSYPRHEAVRTFTAPFRRRPRQVQPQTC